MKATLTKTTLMPLMIASGLVVGIGFVDGKPAEAVGFTGYYDPANWTLTNDNANGSVDTTLAPNQITLTGGDGGFGFGSTGSTLYSILADQTGIFKFAWDYVTTDSWGPFWDPFVVINGLQLQLTDNSGPNAQSGFYSEWVTVGTEIGFGILTVDNAFGAASVTISDFEVVPTPAAVLPGLMGMGAAVFRKKKQGEEATQEV